MSISHHTGISLIGASTGEIHDKELEIRWGVSESPFGNMFVARSPRGITHLSFFDDDEAESMAALRKDWPMAGLIRDDGAARDMAWETDTLHVTGTAFQIRVWKALLEIPRGCLSTYGSLAEKIGMPGAARAVGNAVGANRISLLIPCHRVIREGGGIGGYRWGVERKRAMLATERPLTPP
jgi:AraC family transcriptional regulator, regulatory protein of adaptative response / methylated-DNA-[protein]-cysteine methyltransferase